jgi:hypothetical protein
MAPGRGRRAALPILGLFLAGCLTSVPTPRPVDFPFHVAASPIDIHWRLDIYPDAAQAEGLVQRRQHDIGSASLQLVGLDPTGQVVSFTAPLQVHWRSESDLEPFAITLRPRGKEQRFEVRLHSFEYHEEMSR